MRHRVRWLLLALVASGIGAVASMTSRVRGSVDGAVFEPAAVSFISPAKGWVLGRVGCRDCAALRVTSDGGRHWAALAPLAVPLGYYSRSSGAVSDLSFVDQVNGFLFAPGLLSTHNGGRSWRRQSIPPVQQVSVGAVYAYALTRATGTEGHAALWRTPIGQDRWKRLPLPAAAASPPRMSVFTLELAVEGAEVALLQPGFNGPQVAPNLVGRIWSSDDLGASWRSRSVPCTTADGGAAILAIARAHAYSWLIDCFDNEQSSQEQNTQHHMYHSADAGASWMRVSDPTRHNMPDLLADNGAGHTFLTTAGVSDTLVGSFDDGDHWRLLLRSGGSFSGWADLRFMTTKIGFVLGPTHYAPEHLYRTDNGGRSWRILPVS